VTRLVRAELLKLRTTRLILWLALLILGLALLVITLNATQSSVEDLESMNTQRDLLSVAGVAALMSLILGIVAAAGEWAHGTIAHTFLVAPVRERVVLAKLIGSAVGGLALGVFAGAVCYGLTALWLAGKGISSHLGSWDAASVIVGTLVAAAVTGPIGVGLGLLFRRQTAAIVLALVWLLVGEPLISIAGVQEYAPGHAVASVVQAGHQGSDLLTFGGGLAVALLYAVVLGALGTLTVKGSDVS
jgi:ABC-2 type transport system permease protein